MNLHKGAAERERERDEWITKSPTPCEDGKRFTTMKSDGHPGKTLIRRRVAGRSLANFFCRISEGGDDSRLRPAAATRWLAQHSQGLSCSGAACSAPPRSPGAMIHAERSAAAGVIHHQVSWWAEREGPLTNGSAVKISSLKGRKETAEAPDHEVANINIY